MNQTGPWEPVLLLFANYPALGARRSGQIHLGCLERTGERCLAEGARLWYGVFIANHGKNHATTETARSR